MQQERQKHNKIGDSGFYHFYGVVEDRKDPKKLGRIRVRCFGEHTEDLTQLPTEELPWAKVILPLSDSPNNALNVWDGQLVFGFFADGVEKQVPIILGAVIVDGKTVIDPEGKKLTGFQDQREKKDITLIDDKSWASTGINASPRANEENYGKSLQKKARDETRQEKVSGSLFDYEEEKENFASKYPFNHSQEFESGHIIEYDDTPGNERIYLFHRSGSFIESDKEGNWYFKSVSEAHHLTNSDRYDITTGNTEEHTGGSKRDQIKGSYDISVEGGNLTINVADSAIIKTGSNINLSAGGNIDINASGNVKITGSRVDLN